MDPRRLLTFRTVAHERSFSRAAETLSLSQPSVSHQIALLETETGVVGLLAAFERLFPFADLLGHDLHLTDTRTVIVAIKVLGSVRSDRTTSAPRSRSSPTTPGSIARTSKSAMSP